MVNLFVVDRDPIKSAQDLCDKHVVKMPLETAQILSSAFPKEEPFESLREVKPRRVLYRQTHLNHKICRWTRETEENFLWTVRHGIGLCVEFRVRYGHAHSSESVILWCMKNVHKLQFPSKGLTEFVQAISPDCYLDDPVEAYRKYYVLKKSHFAKWLKGRQPPQWWHEEKQRYHDLLVSEQNKQDVVKEQVRRGNSRILTPVA